MIVYIDKNRYIGNLEERLYSLWREEQRLYRAGGGQGFKSAAGITSPAKNGIVTGSPSIQSVLNSKFTNAADNPNVNPALKARLQFARDTYGSVNDMKGSGVTATDLRTMTGQTDLLNNPVNKNKSNIKSNSNNPVNNPTNNPINNPTKNSTDNPINNPTERSGHMNTMRQRYDRSMARRQRVEANNQNKDVFQQPLNNYVDPKTQAPKSPSNQSQNQGSNPADNKPPIVSTEQTQKAAEITSVANNSADAAKTPAVKKMEEQASKNSLSTEQMNKMQANAADISKNKAGGEGQQLSLFDQQTPDNTKKPVEPVKPTEPVKPVETPPAGGGAGDTNGAATSQTATDTTDTTTNTANTNTNGEKKKIGIGGKIALGTAATIGIGAMGYAMGSGNNKDDDKRQ